MGQVDATEVGSTTATTAPPAAPATPFMFTYRNGIDVKGRVVLPAPYRAHFATGGKLTYWRGPSLAAMTSEAFAAYVEDTRQRLAASGEADPAFVLSQLHAHSIEVKPDPQGRILLPDSLRALAGLGTEVQFTGCGDRVELTAVDDSAEHAADVADALTTLTMMQAGHGLPTVGS